jgi:hypothetical protein
MSLARRLVTPMVRAVRDLDRGWQRARRPQLRNVVFDARTAMEYAMMAPVHRRLLADGRVRTWLMSSSPKGPTAAIFRDAPDPTSILTPRAASTRRFDAYIAADLVWATLPRGTRRVQMFHGVAGKWSQVYDRPASSMRHWDRLFFINRRRLNNYVASGAIDADSAACRLVGMPKSDCLVDGTWSRDGVLKSHGLDPTLRTVLYAPTWTRFSSLNVMGEELVRRLVETGMRVFVKLHENSLDPAYVNSGGIDWIGRLEPLLRKGSGHLIRTSDASPWLVASDAMITDHSSIGFEYLLLDRPVIRIALPELISGANIAAEYVELMASVSTSVERAAEAVAAVESALANPVQLASARRSLAAELFHAPGRATDRALEELYELIELDDPVRLASTAAVHAMVPTTERFLSR